MNTINLQRKCSKINDRVLCLPAHNGLVALSRRPASEISGLLNVALDHRTRNAHSGKSDWGILKWLTAIDTFTRCNRTSIAPRGLALFLGVMGWRWCSLWSSRLFAEKIHSALALEIREPDIWDGSNCQQALMCGQVTRRQQNTRERVVEKKAVEAAGLRYLNIPVTLILPSDEQVVEFARIVEESTYFPLLIHCGSANRVGAIWVLYLVHRGIPISIAVEEGRTIGMQGDRENAVLEYLGHPER